MIQRTDRVPVVRVLDELETRHGEGLPHVYGDGTLCLHLAGEWKSDMFIGESTLVWTAEWLLNYEIWKATGHLHGGGEWPPTRPVVPSPDRNSPRGAEHNPDSLGAGR
ncbi:MAG: hypothetical protein ACYDH6_24320 [Acidimicrobiales bacterium]